MLSKLEPTIVFDSYWHFASERQKMYLKRLENPIGPWTQDSILNAYRFTNTFRASDRVSQYLIENVQYSPIRSQEPAEVIFRTLLFKTFNKIETWEIIEKDLGPISWQSFDINAVDSILTKSMKRGYKIYSAAYIMPSPNLGQIKKHSNHLRLLSKMMEESLPNKLMSAKSLEEVYQHLLSYNGLGPFLAFQYTIDLNYSSAINFDEASFVIPGPGALDGISKCFSKTDGLTPTEIIMAVTEMQDAEFKRLNKDFSGLFGRKLQPIDAQNCFCEISKYSRLAHPEFKGVAGRSKIKQTYQSAPKRIPQPFFPPKWNLTIPVFKNDNLPLPGEQGTLF